MSAPAAQRRQRGEQVYREVLQTEPPARATVFQLNGRLDQEFAELWTRDVLSRVERRWITIAGLAGQPAPRMLRAHVFGALKSGDITVPELLEAVFHVGLYRGFGLAESLEDVIVDVARELDLPIDGVGDIAPTEWTDEQSRIEAGYREFCAVMVFAPPPANSDPYTREGIHKSVFGEMWRRSGLAARHRRLITLACVATSGVLLPVTSHVQAAMETGEFSTVEVQEVMFHLAYYCGWPQGSQMNVAVQTGAAAIASKQAGQAEVRSRREHD